MKKILFTALLFCAMSQVEAQKTTIAQPNVIIIMADDLGYSDLGCYGGEIQTPNLDKLAANGLRMNNFHNNSRCCPTRASLLTGQYAHKVGLANNGSALTKNAITIPELLKENGYQTGMVGKWHLSDDIQLSTPEKQLKWLNHQDFLDSAFASKSSYPINRGFQKHHGVIWGVVNYFDPFSLVEGETPVKTIADDFYMTDVINKKSVEYINEFTAQKKPYFLYVAHTAPHWPIQARPEDIAKYKDTYKIGWDELRKQRYQKMVKMGLLNPKTTPMLEVMGKQGAWEKLTSEQKEFQAMKMATHAAMIDRIDQGVGQIIETLTQNKTLNNTIIMFLTDNGASPEVPLKPGYDRPSHARNGQKLLYDQDLKANQVGSALSFTGIGSNWSNAANTPYKFWKMESYEGGIHTPMIVHWPAGLKTPKGSINNSLGHVSDVLPTLLEINKIAYPKTYQSNTLTALDGKSFLPILKAKSKNYRDTIFFEHAKGKAFIKGNLKIVQKVNTNTWEMFDLSKDTNESNNIFSTNTAIAQQMIKAWENWYDSLKPYIAASNSKADH
ncbi:MAG: arylsulfatase [Pseudarcicella sp.]|nr:arylsulfatase [Pseudarcicella sp.]